MLLRPFNLFIVRSTYCHELCSRSAIQKVQSMALAHASETRTSDLKLSRRHFQIGKGGGEELELNEGREKSSEAERRAEEEDFLNSHQRQKLNILQLSGVKAIQKLLVSG
jgi:formate hydrogenlyase subunit 6/NADH:ubiquinone oxidoreductase subunit I